MPKKNPDGHPPKFRAIPEQSTLEGQAMALALRAMMKEAGVNPNKTAHEIGASHSQIYALLNGDRNFSPLLALKLATYFGTDPEALMLLQIRRDLAEAMAKHAAELESIVPVKGRAP